MNTSPTSTTDFTRFDLLEIHPVCDVYWDDATMGQRPFPPPNHHKSCEETCEPHEAHFWSVYGHLNEGGLECLDDFATEEDAYRFARSLQEAHPHLQKYGML